MKRHQFFLILIVLSLFSIKMYGQNPAIQLSASVQQAPPQITLSWQPLSTHSNTKDTGGIYIYKKVKDDTSWHFLTAISETDTSFLDIAVALGSSYEYKLQRLETDTSLRLVPHPSKTCPRCLGPDTYILYDTAYKEVGYIYSGIKSSPIHNKGTLILLVDSIFIDSCTTEIRQFMKDISGDGWEIIRHNVSRSLKDTGIRAIIKNYYLSAPNSITAVLLLGHIAVPYSGEISPDGHNDHHGAWPADIYYGDTYTENGPDTFWTDYSITTDSDVMVRNQNMPGDGKWDQSWVFNPNDKKRLQVSRIDFYDMPAFGKTEVQLMKNYLGKNHLYKMDSIDINHRALVDANFGFGEDITAQMSFPPLVGRNNISTIDFISSLNSSSYQWAYGSGPGSFTSCDGIGTTYDFTVNNVNGIFTMLFGSYFGDWDNVNNFLRAPLCANTPALTSCWSTAGSLQWYFHHMALGENIGYSIELGQAKNLLYYSQKNPAIDTIGQLICPALMGDLTLRTDYLQPARNLTIGAAHTGSHLSWGASADTGVMGYYIYRSDNGEFGNYQKVSSLVTSTTYNDNGVTTGLRYYMVRPVKLQCTPSGTYYNLGIGITNFINYNDNSRKTGITEVSQDVMVLYPNPANDKISLKVNGSYDNATFRIIDENGKTVTYNAHSLNKDGNIISFDIRRLTPGIYVLEMTTDKETATSRFVKIK